MLAAPVASSPVKNPRRGRQFKHVVEVFACDMVVSFKFLWLARSKYGVEMLHLSLERPTYPVQRSSTIGFDKMPTPSTSISHTSPGAIHTGGVRA